MKEPAARLLPWSSPNGNPCYLLGDGTGPVSRVADDIERLQLGMADDLIGHADGLLACQGAGNRELRFLARGLTDCLRDVRRVAESRGRGCVPLTARRTTRAGMRAGMRVGRRRRAPTTRSGRPFGSKQGSWAPPLARFASGGARR